jgi:hypothetical protein
MVYTRHTARPVVPTALMLLIVACNGDAQSGAPVSSAAALTPYLTGAAANALQPNGQFTVDPGESPDGTPMISEGSARALAMAYVRSFGPSFHGVWERERGAPIDLSTITVGPRIYFAHTPYGAFPSGLHPAFRRSYGPYFLVTLLSKGEPVIEMAVSAYNTDTRTNSVGQLVLPPLGGMGFIHEGIPVNRDSYRLLSPEEAAAAVSSGSRARVATPPKLMLRAHDTSALLAVWQMDTERDVSIQDRGDSRARTARAFFVSSRAKDRFLRAEDVQPASESGEGPTVSSTGELGPATRYEVPIQHGRPTKYRAISFTRGR